MNNEINVYSVLGIFDIYVLISIIIMLREKFKLFMLNVEYFFLISIVIILVLLVDLFFKNISLYLILYKILLYI